MRKAPDNVLRRPSDLAAEQRDSPGRKRRRGPSGDDEDAALAWPPRFAVTPDDREALLILLHLASLTARRLLELASVHRTASACLDAVRSGEAGSDGDRSFAARLEPDHVARQLEAVEGRLVVAGDPEYPAELHDLFDPPAGVFVRGRPLVELIPRVAIWAPGIAHRPAQRSLPRWRLPWPGSVCAW